MDGLRERRFVNQEFEHQNRNRFDKRQKKMEKEIMGCWGEATSEVLGKMENSCANPSSADGREIRRSSYKGPHGVLQKKKCTSGN